MIYDLKTIKETYFAEKNNTKRDTNESSNFFSFSKLSNGDVVRIRFVEDMNNPQFQWFGIKRAVRQLVFNGAVSNGQFYEGEVVVEVPAFNLKKGETDETLPPEYQFKSEEDTIQQLIGPLWDGSEEGTARYQKFKRKESFLYQGFIHTEGYEPKLYRFLFSSNLNSIINSCTDDEQINAFPTVPCHPVDGREFVLKVKMENNRKNYSSSSWALSKNELSDTEKKYIDENGTYNLLDYIPKKPTQQQLEVMADMFQAVCNEESYDFDKWGSILKPSNCFRDSTGLVKFRYNNQSTDTELPKSVATQVEAPTTSAITMPEKISTVEVNNAIETNTVNIDNSNVNELVANLMSQFK